MQPDRGDRMRGRKRGNRSDDGEAAIEQDEERYQPAEYLLFRIML
jgi:hypothetical protein